MTATVDKERLDYLRRLQRHNAGYRHFDALPHQKPPDGDWFFWLLEGGRGSGKSVASVAYVRDHLNGPACISDRIPHRVSLIAPTLGDAVESADLQDLSLTKSQPGAKLSQARGGSMVRWPNGSQVRLFGTHTREDVERLRAGGNRCLVWVEELAAWRYMEEAWAQMMFGLRLGPQPRIIGSTTPKPRPAYKLIRKQADYITHASTADNPHLNTAQKERLYQTFEGTSLGAQELYGELIDEAEGALWSYELIDSGRLESVTAVGRTVVAVDPPGGVTEAGIVAAALLSDCRCGNGPLPHYAVLEDASAKLSPEQWASRAVGLYDTLGADRIVAERNFGGDMVESTIRNVDRAASVTLVNASRGKRQRAEPIKALYEQGRVHHVGTFPELETEMVQWVPDESEWSPNRLDALVWALTELSGAGEPTLWFA